MNFGHYICGFCCSLLRSILILIFFIVCEKALEQASIVFIAHCHENRGCFVCLFQIPPQTQDLVKEIFNIVR